MALYIQPIDFREACQFVQWHHRHHGPPQGHKFSLAVSDESGVRGVAIVGRPVARHFDDGLTLEVTRLCSDGARNACSMLYGAAWRAARALGYRRLVTYTLASEAGGSVRAAGWRAVGEAGGSSWSRASRPRQAPREPGLKTLWEMVDADVPVGRLRLVDPQAADVGAAQLLTGAGVLEVTRGGLDGDVEDVRDAAGGFGT